MRATSRNLDIRQSNVDPAPYPGVTPGTTRSEDPAAAPCRRSDVHVVSRIADFLAGRLDPESDASLEAHLLACDGCFAAYVVATLSAD